MNPNFVPFQKLTIEFYRDSQIHPPSLSKFTPFCFEGSGQYMSIIADPRALLCKKNVYDFRQQKLSNLSALLVLSLVNM